jgi:hypothetical protein
LKELLNDIVGPGIFVSRLKKVHVFLSPFADAHNDNRFVKADNTSHWKMKNSRMFLQSTKANLQMYKKTSAKVCESLSMACGEERF